MRRRIHLKFVKPETAKKRATFIAAVVVFIGYTWFGVSGSALFWVAMLTYVTVRLVHLYAPPIDRVGRRKFK